jgi:hypothetical protein
MAAMFLPVSDTKSRAATSREAEPEMRITPNPPFIGGVAMAAIVSNVRPPWNPYSQLLENTAKMPLRHVDDFCGFF